ncbi:MAG: DNA repair protein RadC [Flavobacteriales bacterium]|nr:DNA repair protein RadC [Flavobacteriales bacterium]
MDLEVRPRERLLMDGPQALSDQELLALIIGSGPRGSNALEVGGRLLDLVSSNLDSLGRIPTEAYMEIAGVGAAKAVQLSAALELGRRRHRAIDRHDSPAFIRSSSDVHSRFVLRLTDLQHEEFWLILLRRSNEIITELMISRGGLTGTVADPKIIFGKALAFRAAAIVAVHNHPSGNIQPSQSDRTLTKNLQEAGVILDCPLLDHIIVSRERYFSFADQGEL